MRRVLQNRVVTVGGNRFPIAWSERKKSELTEIARGALPARSAIEAALALPLIRCSDGDFNRAEQEILHLLQQHLPIVKGNDDFFISYLEALFVLQRLDLVAAMLQDRYGFPRPLRLSVEPKASAVGLVQWQISLANEKSEHRFIFDADVFSDDRLRQEILAFQWEFPLLSHYANSLEQDPGTILINRHDIGLTPGLAYCDNRPEFYLIPDFVYVSTRGYAYARQVFRDGKIPWAQRSAMAFWRGSTTGIPGKHGDWSSLPRAKLCQLAQRHASSGLFDVGFNSIVYFGDETATEIRKLGLIRDAVPWQEWNRYKFQIDIDGNTNAWSGLFQRLLTGSPVLKVESSQGLVQWYYDQLRPWDNYVPVSPDLSDLVHKIRWLQRNDSIAEQIGRRGFELTERLSYERELNRSVPVIAAAFRHFNGKPSNAGPFGRAGYALGWTYTQPYWTSVKI